MVGPRLASCFAKDGKRLDHAEYRTEESDHRSDIADDVAPFDPAKQLKRAVMQGLYSQLPNMAVGTDRFGLIDGPRYGPADQVRA